MARPAREVDFFRIWSPEMAYVLGYWWADGCMRIKNNTGAHEIRIASNDLDHLENIARIIGENYYMEHMRGTRTYVLSYCSKSMYHDILAWGGTPRKSTTIGFPTVPQTCLPHFIRGVIDGDGTLIWNGSRPVIQIYSGSRKLLEDLGSAIENTTGIPAPNIATNRDNWYIKWSTTRAKYLTVWLYIMNPGIYLQRKYETAQTFINWHPKKRPQRGTITDQMYLHFADYLPE